MSADKPGSADRIKADIEAFAKAKLDRLSEQHLYRSLKPTRRHPGGGAERDRVALVSFSDNDYLGLSQDPRVKQAAAAAAMEHGTGSGASRLITGDCPLNHELEDLLARMKDTEAALVFGSGYLANISTIPVLAGREDLVVLDELSQSCMHAGARLSGATVRTFRHNDTEDAARQLEMPGASRKLILT
ncbi:MAG: aminotransferase class I/II-fold pyridoxal phosphate-dependent enzyme, partial [Alphaproteobacteria bacterium]|nr:aminotransferase class I/II-fold pyridoxal phosphate-dependent enzyme [Alphaproteobacteria bacterium]